MPRLLVLLAVLCVGLSAHADGPWQHMKTAKDVRYEKRTVDGSKFLEYRATWFVAREPRALLQTIWEHLEKLRGPHVAARQVLRRGASELVTHDYIKTPIVSDREVTLRFEKNDEAPYLLRYTARNELGPPPAPKRVVLPVVRGGWRITPAPGGSEVIYDCYSEPGGSVPAWMVRGAQQDQLMDDVERLRAQLR
jgi:hypothetical protein